MLGKIRCRISCLALRRSAINYLYMYLVSCILRVLIIEEI